MIKEQNKIGFSIVGCGSIASRHAQHIANFGRLISVGDIKKDRADKLATKYRVKAYYNIDNLLSNSHEAQVISICTPNGLHAEHTIKALTAGYHVLCEKPMALSAADCQRMIAAADKAGKKLFIVKQNRFNPPVAAVKKLLDENHLGKILSVELNCFWNRSKDYYDQSDWKGSQDLDGGALFTQFSHFIDLLYWFFGDVEKLTSYVTNSHHPYIEIDDSGVVILKFKNGIIGSINYTVNSFQKNMEGSITIFGENGTVKIGGQYLNELEYQLIDGYEIKGLPKSARPNDYGTYQGSMSNHDKIYENVIKVLKNNASISTSGQEGLKTVEIINRIYKETKTI